MVVYDGPESSALSDNSTPLAEGGRLLRSVKANMAVAVDLGCAGRIADGVLAGELQLALRQ